MINRFKKRLLWPAIMMGCTLAMSVPSHANLQSKFLFLGQKTCASSLGSLRIVEPDDLTSWRMLGLSAPTRMLRVFADESKCFTVVDRGLGFSAAQLERELANSGQLKSGQNIGAGQMRAADYVLIPDIIGQNLNAGGSSYGISGKGESSGGFLGSLANTMTLGLAGKLGGSSHRKTAEVVLTLIDVRTSEQVASVNAEAKVTDRIISAAIEANQGKNSGEAHYSSWNNTPIGKVIKEAYNEAFDALMVEVDKKGLLWRQSSAPVAVNEPQIQQVSAMAVAPVVNQLQQVQQDVAVVQTANTSAPTATQINLSDLASKSSLGLSRVARLLAEASAQAQVLTELKPGMLVYPTGETEGNMLKVEDEMGHIGWVPRGALAVTP